MAGAFDLDDISADDRLLLLATQIDMLADRLEAVFADVDDEAAAA